MTEQEIIASTNVIAQYELLQWAVGIFGSIVIAMAGAFVVMYRDTSSERKEYYDRLEKLVEKNNEVMNKNNLVIEKLTGVVERTDKSVESLERLILSKMA